MMCITGRDKQAKHSQWNQMASHYKGKHKEAPQPAAGLLEGRVGESRGSMTPTEITPIYSYTTHHILPHPFEAWVKNWKCENIFFDIVIPCNNSARLNFEKCLNKLFFHRNVVVWIRITYTKKVEQISVVFKSLYCLPVCQRIEFKTVLIIYNTLNGPGPKCIYDLLVLYKTSRLHRSSGTQCSQVQNQAGWSSIWVFMLSTCRTSFLNTVHTWSTLNLTAQLNDGFEH